MTSGSFPPGLTLASEGVVSGVPTQAGNFTFYLRVSHPSIPGSCAGDFSDKQVTVPINPGLPKLTIGPETAPVGTVSTPYSLAMTATLPDPKTWSISTGALPPGLTLGATDGLITGTPSTSGSFSFTVLAVLDAKRSDTKALTIDVRNALVISAPQQPDGEPGLGAAEVGALYTTLLTATGGLGTYTWTVASGALPPGVALAADGTLDGRPTAAGTYRFGIAVTDAESRVATYSGSLRVASRLTIVTRSLRLGGVGRAYRAKLVSTGGVLPKVWRVKRGPLPRGLSFDRTLGVLSGTPLRARRYSIVFEIQDELGVKSTQTVLLQIAPALKKRRG